MHVTETQIAVVATLVFIAIVVFQMVHIMRTPQRDKRKR